MGLGIETDWNEWCFGSYKFSVGDPRLKMDDSAKYEAADFNMCLIRNILINPVFSDLLKQ